VDILTPRGQRTVADEALAYRFWEGQNPGWQCVSTPKWLPAAIDGFLVFEGSARAIIECKCRYGLTQHKFFEEFNGEWLVTMEKLVRASRISGELCVPLVGFLHLVDDGCLLTVQITDDQGRFCVPFRCENTVTQATVNGGEITRANAYIQMHGAIRYEVQGRY
jgi:hypothetical protein